MFKVIYSTYSVSESLKMTKSTHLKISGERKGFSSFSVGGDGKTLESPRSDDFQFVNVSI